MRAVLKFLAVGLSAQATFGKLSVQLSGVEPVKPERGLRGGFDYSVHGATAGNNVHQLDVAEPSGNRDLQYSQVSENQAHRQLGSIWTYFTVVGFVIDLERHETAHIGIYLEINAPGRNRFRLNNTIEVGYDGTGVTGTDVNDFFLNDDKTAMCDGCTVTAIAEGCEAGVCRGYDKDASNSNIRASIHGDPHMVGLLGQKIDWAGEDNGWYCLLSDGPDFHVNIRLTAPMPEEFPDRQLISAVSILTDDGLHSLVVEVKDPYTTTTTGCPKNSSVPCLADGGLRILIDGEVSPAIQTPVENLHLPGGSPVVVSAANLPAQCRPFGGDRIWATHFAAMMSNHRNLRLDSVSFAEWVLQPVSLAAPTWCAKYLEEGGSGSLLSTQSEHATFRVETPTATVRINVGVNYQDLETAPDGTVLVPELEFWQSDLGFDGLQLSGNVAGLMGDTSRFVLDDEGVPVMSGLGALHGPVESYRVASPFARDFERLHAQAR